MEKSKKDTRIKASQWLFTVPSVTSKLTNHLSSLISKPNVFYVTFATLKDDAGKHFVQGYIKTKRQHASTIQRLIGPAFVRVCTHFKPMLFEIQLKSFQEFGEDTRSQPFRMSIRDMSTLIQQGASLCELMDTTTTRSNTTHLRSTNPSKDDQSKPKLPPYQSEASTT